MFCGKAAGEFLPPMVVYKSENLYESWIKDDPKNAVYDVTTSGWFHNKNF